MSRTTCQREKGGRFLVLVQDDGGQDARGEVLESGAGSSPDFAEPPFDSVVGPDLFAGVP